MGSLVRAAVVAVVSAQAVAAAADRVVVDLEARAVRVPALVAKQGTYEVLKGAIEYVLVSSGGKAYETIFTTASAPGEIHAALLKIGLRPGEPAEAGTPPRGPKVRILAEYEVDGRKVRRAVAEFIVYARTGKPLDAAPWIFTGSRKAFDPAAGKEVLQTTVTKSIVGLHHTDASPLFQNPRPEARQENIYRVNAKALPAAGTPVTLVFERVVRPVAAGTKRVHVFLSGRVQGVGFRAFAQREARRRKLTGWVKNLADGRVEAVVEGPRERVDALLAKLKRGPRAARVTKLHAREERPAGDFERFDIRY